MKIYIVQIDYSGYNPIELVLPLAPLMVGTPLKQNGFEIEIVHISEKEINKYVNKISKENPLFVGFSVMTGIQTLHSAIMSKEIKKVRKDITIVWGGVHPSILPDSTIKANYVDIIVNGEGEETVVELAKHLKEKKDLEEVKGLIYKKGRTVVKTPKRPFIINLDDYTIDYELIDVNRYAYTSGKAKRVIAYRASRGCPFDCKFCYNLLFNNRKVRNLSVERVVKDIKYLKKKYNMDGVDFYDDLFFTNRKRAIEILKKINMYNTSDIRIDLVTEDLAKDLVKYKSENLLIGMESGSDRVLNLMSKRCPVEKAERGVRILSKYRLKAIYSFMIGLPTETPEEINQTLDFMMKIRKIHPEGTFTLGVYVPYPGSDLYERAIANGFKVPKNPEEWGDVERWKNFKSPWINNEEVYVIRECFRLFSLNLWLIDKIMETRLKFKLFKYPFEIYFVNWIIRLSLKQTILAKILRWVHTKITRKEMPKYDKGGIFRRKIDRDKTEFKKNDFRMNLGKALQKKQ